MRALCLGGGLVAALVFGSEVPQEGAITDLVAGLRLRVFVNGVEGKLAATETIAYELLNSQTNRSQFVFIPENPAYFCEIRLVDANGSIVPKTELGKKVGSLFDGLDLNPKYERQHGPFTVFLNTTNQIRTRQLRIENAAMGPVFFRPIDLFDIRQSGEYTLRLRFQFLRSTTNAAVERMRFPPVELKLRCREGQPVTSTTTNADVGELYVTMPAGGERDLPVTVSNMKN